MTGGSMQWVRSALIFLLLAVTVIPVASILVIASFVAPYRVTYFWIGRPWLQFSIATIRWVGGVDCRLTGYQNLLDAAAGNRVIICSKHQSTFETFFFPSVMTNPIAYVYKKELNLV
ncbi:1-acyl-sn-glycerol-3-phosphate acyltransferase, partial [Luminiphilus sp.]|nr:1-acyl-sn-glycerol-3-phosphate acyltransferase [Luminiphilus sp.]